jgi:hypothetical protein
MHIIEVDKRDFAFTPEEVLSAGIPVHDAEPMKAEQSRTSLAEEQQGFRSIQVLVVVNANTPKAPNGL